MPKFYKLANFMKFYELANFMKFYEPANFIGLVILIQFKFRCHHGVGKHVLYNKVTLCHKATPTKLTGLP